MNSPDTPSPGKLFSGVSTTIIVVAVVGAVLSLVGTIAASYVVYRYIKKNGIPAFSIGASVSVAKDSSTALYAVVAFSIGASVSVAKDSSTALYAVVPDSQMRDATVEKFLKEIAGENPIGFTPQQLSGFTNSYSTRLGAGGFGAVYKGMLPNGLMIAVKRLHATQDDKTAQEQFMAEVRTIGRTHHINLVRLFGFCFDAAAAGVRALVYEYMEHGALDGYLFDRSHAVGFPALRDIAVGVARGLRYLHEECQQKIVHYDIKPGNVLLDGSLTPKVADFGLAKLLNRADTHASVSRVRGTPGYAAPEMWMQARVTEKCDVYSFGLLLFEIVSRRRNFDDAAPQSQQWFPQLAWNKYVSGELVELVMRRGGGDHGVAAADKTGGELAERMCKVTFWCAQPQPEARPSMGTVVKMLEGEMDIAPPANPFQHLTMAPNLSTTMTSSVSTVSASANGLSHGSKEIVLV